MSRWKWWAAGAAVVGVGWLVMRPKAKEQATAPSRLERMLPPNARPYASALLSSASRYAPAGVVTVERFAELLAAVIDHESRWGAFLAPKGPGGTGDGGNGLGLGQIDRRYHAEWAETHPWWEPAVNIDKAAEILASKFQRFPLNHRAALAAYNASEERVARAVAEGRDPQSVTTRGAYVDEVTARLELMEQRVA